MVVLRRSALLFEKNVIDDVIIVIQSGFEDTKFPGSIGPGLVNG